SPRKTCFISPEHGFRRCLALVPVVTIATLGIALVAGQPPPSAVYSADQAAAGRAAYQANCASCHMPDLAGRSEAPPLAGANFMNSWRSRTTRDLFEFIQSTMPPDGSNLTADQYLAIAAFILESNGAPAGAQPLTPTTAAAIGSIAASGAPADAGSARGSRPPSD